MLTILIVLAVLTLIVSGLCSTCWKHQRQAATVLFIGYILFISYIFFTMALGHYNRKSRSDMVESFQEEVDLIAQACFDLLESDISSQDDWEYGIKDLLLKIQADAAWNNQLKGGYILSSGGQDVWDKDLIVYRRNERKEIYLVIESGGPDGDMKTKDDNISSILPLQVLEEEVR